MAIVVGLGNYGDRYAYTFHNMGFLAVECLADRLRVKLDKRLCSSLVGEFFCGGQRHILALPLTYMNLSGVAVKQLLARYEATEADLIVVYDDIDIPRATLRIRERGSAGTHNGMRSVIGEIGTSEFRRVRIGIGQPPEDIPLADYVLCQIPKSERPALAQAIEQAADYLEAQLRTAD